MSIAQRALILGSTSRYRRELLERLRVPFDVVSPDVDETPLPGVRAFYQAGYSMVTAVGGSLKNKLFLGKHPIGLLALGVCALVMARPAGVTFESTSTASCCMFL
mgnify:CR=1 FL=1